MVQEMSSPVQRIFADAIRHHQARRLHDAIACYQKTIDLKPDFPDAHNNMGVALREQGRLTEAVACYRRAVNLKPDYPDAHSNLGAALQAQGRLDEAVACYQRAINLKPDFADAYNNLGTVLQAQGRLAEAVACCQRAIDLKPDFAIACCNLGAALQAQDRLDEAVAGYQKAIKLKPDYPQAYIGLGSTLQRQGRLAEAVTCFRKVIELRPDDPDAHNNLAMTLLMRGEMAAGWAEYEWRWKTPQMIRHRRDFANPQWSGEAAEGRTLLIHAEQGFGDTVQFCRYAPLAAARGLRVIMDVPTPLVRLMRSLAGVDLVVAHGDEPPQFDLHCPMLSMPLALGTTLETIPGAVPYLQADGAQVGMWHSRLATMAKKDPRIGLAWAGNPRNHSPTWAAVDRRRSLALDRLAPLFGLAGLHFFSLQKDRSEVPVDFPLTDLMNEMEDFADTAALIANLDLVISVDTAVVHLAGALGKPVWMLDRFESDWRWLIGRRDSLWYPTLRLYRQPYPGDWESVLADVARDLRCLFPCAHPVSND